jgi:LEA14-like dessication related protein
MVPFFEVSMKRRELLQTGLVASTALTTTGCATLWDLLLGQLKAPDMSHKSFKVKKTTLSSFQVSLVALIKNPNPFGFHLDGLDWIVDLAGGQTAKGKSPKGLTLKAKGTSETQLDLDFNIAKTAEAILELIEKKVVPLKLDAVGHLRANKYKFDVPASFDTKLPLPQIPKLDIPTFRMKGLRGSNLLFEVEPLVTNPNGFDVDIDAFDFDVKLEGRSVLKNKIVKNIKLQSKKKARVPFEFDVGLAEIGMSLAKIATNPRVDWELAANLKSGILHVPFKEGGRVTLS